MPVSWDEFEAVGQPATGETDWSQFEASDKPSIAIKPTAYEEALPVTRQIGTGMEAGTEFTRALWAEAVPAVSRGISAAIHPVGVAAADVLNLAKVATAPETALMTGGEADITPYAKAGVPLLDLPLAAPEEKGIIPSLSRFAAGFTTPENLALLPFAAVKPVQALFTAQAAAQIPESLQALSRAAKPAETRGALTDIAANLVIGGLMGRALTKTRGAPDASQISKTAEVHGDVRQQPEPGVREVSAEVGGPRIQPQTEALAKEAQVSLTPEEHSYLETERAAIDHPVKEWTEVTGDEPFAGRIGTVDPVTGEIMLNRGEFKKWIKDKPPEQAQEMVRSFLAEESNHLQTLRTVGNEGAAEFWRDLSGLEQRFHFRRYTGHSTPEELFKARGLRFSDAQLGHEAINSFMMRAARMPLREFVEAAGREKWTVKTLDALANIVFKVRQALGTKASGRQIAILDRVQRNIGAAAGAATGGTPAAFVKEADDPITALGQMMVDINLRPNNQHSTAAGLAVKNIDDLNRLLGLRTKATAENKNLLNRFLAASVPEREVIANQAMLLSTRGQLPREAIEVATNTGSWSESEGFQKLGPRPLDWKDNPQVAQWLKENAAKVGITLPDELTGETTPAALRKERKGEAELFLPPAPKGVERGGAEVGGPIMAKPGKLDASKIGYDQPIQEPAWRPITEGESASPTALSEVLTKDARTGGAKAPESMTHRVTVLQDKATGRVEVVSTYKHGRRGVMLADPSKAFEDVKRPHRQLTSLLPRYKPLYSVYLSEPVQNFHERFASLQDFYSRFGDQAIAASREATGIEPTQVTPAPEAPPAPEGPTDAEIGALHDYFEGKAPDSIEAMRGQLLKSSSATNRQLISGLKKAMEHEISKDPNINPETAIDRAIKNLYEDITQTKTRAEYVQKSLERFGESPAGRIQEAVIEPTAEFAAEAEADIGEEIGPAPPSKAPAAFRKAKKAAEDQLAKRTGEIMARLTRGATQEEMVRMRDGYDRIAGIVAKNAKRGIELESASKKLKNGRPEILAAARAMNAALAYVRNHGGTRQQAYTEFLRRTDAGAAKAQNLINARDWYERRQGNAWLEATQQLRGEIEYAAAHDGEAELRGTVHRLRTELDNQYLRERQAGVAPRYEANYLPGLYDAEFFNDEAIQWGEKRVLGRQYRKPAVFEDYYQAIEAGPYIPKSNSVADIAASRIEAGQLKAGAKLWAHSQKNIIDPRSNEPVAKEPIFDEATKQWLSPGPEYQLIHITPGTKPLAVRQGYARVMRQMLGQSGIADWELGRAALRANAFIKHGLLLIADTFHLGRLADYAVALTGGKAGFMGGFTAVEFAEADLPNAVRRGVVSQAAADWAMTAEQIQVGNRTVPVSRLELARMLAQHGLNIGRVQDALFKHFVDNWWGIGRYNRFLFDKFTRGLIIEGAVREFVRLNKASPGTDASQLMGRVNRDINIYYGNLGRQGILRSATARDIAQLVSLAPQWVEGLVRKEVAFGYRAIKAPADAALYGKAVANVNFGTIGRGVGRGLLAMFALTQAINLITRRQLTFQNEEEGHKLDAWIPTFGGDGPGFWFSPMAVFAEITHDVVRLAETKPTFWDAIRQIGENKLNPLGRMAVVLGTGRTPTGQVITTTAGVAKEAAKAFAPLPISLARFAQAGAHALTPGLVPPTPPGTVQRQAFASAGVKIEPGQTVVAQIQQKAERFMRQEGLKKDTGWQQIQTDEPSYTKLRGAVRNNDVSAIKWSLDGLRKTHNDNEILKAMKVSSERPFTSSSKGERLFLYSLTEKELEAYSQAQQERKETYEKFLHFHVNER